MSAQNLMDGFDAYVDADELGAVVAQEPQESVLVSALASALASAVSALTAEHTC
jgi:hypothetical protein